MPRLRATATESVQPIRASPRKRQRIGESTPDLPVVNSANDAAKSYTSRRGANSKPTTHNSRVVKARFEAKELTRKPNNNGPSASNVAKKVEITEEAQPPIVKAEDTPVTTADGGALEEQPEDSDSKPKQTRKRKTKEQKDAEAMPLAARTKGLKMFVGAHVSIAKGVENAITNSLHIGGNAFALFLKSQRKWDNPALKDENMQAFKQHCAHHQYDAGSHVVPHGSYLVNLASPDKDMSKKSYDAFVDDLHRCEKLGIKYYNFHPGSTNKEPLDEAIGRLAGNLNRALAETSTVVPLLENMAGRGSVIGSRFTDLRDIIAAIKPEFKSRIGICIDTCHTFAAGYDLRSPEAFQKTFQELDDTVGLEYLKAMHINDSKAPLDSHRDLHQNIGVGFLGLRAFHNLMNDPRFCNIPLVLETPCDKPDPSNPKKTIDDKNVWAREIKLLESLIGMDAEGEEFKKLEAELSRQGEAEREKMQKSIDLKGEKEQRKMEKELAKGQKTINGMLGGNGKKRKASVSSNSDVE